MESNILASIINDKPDAPFEEIRGENIALATIKFFISWNGINLERIHYTPYG